MRLQIDLCPGADLGWLDETYPDAPAAQLFLHRSASCQPRQDMHRRRTDWLKRVDRGLGRLLEAMNDLRVVICGQRLCTITTRVQPRFICSRAPALFKIVYLFARTLFVVDHASAAFCFSI